MREPKNAVNFASKTWSIGIGGGIHSLTGCMFIYILALLRMLNLVFFILKVCLLAALYYQLQPPRVDKTPTCVQYMYMCTDDFRRTSQRLWAQIPTSSEPHPPLGTANKAEVKGRTLPLWNTNWKPISTTDILLLAGRRDGEPSALLHSGPKRTPSS